MYLQIGRVTSQDSLEYLKFPRFVSNANLKSTASESKNVHGKDYIKLYPLSLFLLTSSSSLSHWLNPRSSMNNLLKLSNAVKHSLGTYNWFVLISGDLGLLMSFRFVW